MIVKGFKLLNGEEIIARVDENMTSHDKYSIKRPMVIIPQKMGNQVSIGLVPWIISANEDISLDLKDSVIASPFTPIKEIQDEYIKQTTGIQIVTG